MEVIQNGSIILIWDKCTDWPKMNLNTTRSNIHHIFSVGTDFPDFNPNHSMMSFRVMYPFRQAHRIAQKCPKVRNFKFILGPAVFKLCNRILGSSTRYILSLALRLFVTRVCTLHSGPVASWSSLLSFTMFPVKKKCGFTFSYYILLPNRDRGGRKVVLLRVGQYVPRHLGRKCAHRCVAYLCSVKARILSR